MLRRAARLASSAAAGKRSGDAEEPAVLTLMVGKPLSVAAERAADEVAVRWLQESASYQRAPVSKISSPNESTETQVFFERLTYMQFRRQNEERVRARLMSTEGLDDDVADNEIYRLWRLHNQRLERELARDLRIMRKYSDRLQAAAGAPPA
ncbi:hypothetical protein DIPPA_70036 [Diplonema papillatum]|nr:hypothetical protein DIPPA_01944 [Diplonema papillatum]KAJ9473594.1 hypothetical protein DIPPA_70036 [Diplonema papillatum]